ncbi:PREDICTED: uncharacterized protein LOC109467641 [Branchiostoma belcheri]|uniref:Uncharacterized protein LOC109467641 n=1 Tax=Branchiostoma belcheri TaxID=7741 RepID=A0A6P4YVF5_BRABE|nr:PREDICTED: uncharacterized protein LOC109467641 [Branchiostoma belcheri]
MRLKWNKKKKRKQKRINWKKSEETKEEQKEEAKAEETKVEQKEEEKTEETKVEQKEEAKADEAKVEPKAETKPEEGKVEEPKEEAKPEVADEGADTDSETDDEETKAKKDAVKQLAVQLGVRDWLDKLKEQKKILKKENEELKAKVESKGDWITAEPPWVIESSGKEQTGYEASNVLNSKADAFWRCPEDQHLNFIVFDFRTEYTLSQIKLTNVGDTDHDVKSFTLQTSACSNPFCWTDVKVFTDVAAGTKAPQVFGGFEASARYWRVLVTKTHKLQPNLVQVEFFGKKGEWLYGHPPLAIESSSSSDGSEVLDGSSTTFWTDGQEGQTSWHVTFDFLNKYVLSGLRITTAGDTTHDVRSFTLQRSPSCAPYKWTDVKTVTDVKAGLKTAQEFSGFQCTASARYWRLVINATQSTSQPHVTEVSFFGFSDEADCYKHVKASAISVLESENRVLKVKVADQQKLLEQLMATVKSCDTCRDKANQFGQGQPAEEQVKELRAMAKHLGMEKEIEGTLQHMQHLAAEHETLKMKIDTVKKEETTFGRQANPLGARQKSVVLPKGVDRPPSEKETKSPWGILATMKSEFQKLRPPFFKTPETPREQPPAEPKEPRKETATGSAAPVAERKKKRKKKKKSKQSPQPVNRQWMYHHEAIAESLSMLVVT